MSPPPPPSELPLSPPLEPAGLDCGPTPGDNPSSPLLSRLRSCPSPLIIGCVPNEGSQHTRTTHRFTRNSF
uniref:Uncharacterized protein n=1 Tax=Tetraselmis sp. GSL018 TaxID=582737 RepID=A0A061RKU3_9CHLO